MTIDYEDALARSRDVPAFSNGTEGEVWMANWCHRCLRDAPFRNGIAKSGCPLILVALMDRTPAEWLDGPRDEQGRYSMADQFHCIEFRGPGGRGGEPRPKPDPRGMDPLFPRPERATRMFVQPTPTPAAEPVHADAVSMLLAACRDDIDSVPHAPGLATSALLARLEAA